MRKTDNDALDAVERPHLCNPRNLWIKPFDLQDTVHC
jgi:hypothetical protein